jgi:adenine specific DNA methylase Mod
VGGPTIHPAPYPKQLRPYLTQPQKREDFKTVLGFLKAKQHKTLDQTKYRKVYSAGGNIIKLYCVMFTGSKYLKKTSLCNFTSLNLNVIIGNNT